MKKQQLIRGSFLSICHDALALHEQTLQELISGFRLSQANVDASQEMASLDDYLPSVDELIVADGVAVIPVHGIMVKRSQVWYGWDSIRVLVGVDYWSTITDDLVNRNDIETFVYDFDTGGGQVAGTQQFADAIWNARQAGKKTIAVCNEFCASAGLWAAAQCERVVIPATGSIGSLGVYTMHFDDTAFLKDRLGYEKTVIHRGKYKGIDERPLDPDSKADLQRFIDAKYSLFVDAIARGRNLNPAEVTKRWGDSQLLSGSEAISSGLVDELGTLQDVLESLRAGRGGRVSIELPADNQGEPEAMKLNAQGQLLDQSGKVVGNLSELGLNATDVQKHFAVQTTELIEAATVAAKKSADDAHKAALAAGEKASAERLDALVTAVGAEKAVVAFRSGQTVEQAEASLAKDLKAQLAEKDKEIAALKANGGSVASNAPKFVPSDGGGLGDGKAAPAATGADKDAPYADAYATNGEGFPNLAAYAAYKRYQERTAAL